MSKPVIAIDGPSASGKGTLARQLASVLNYSHLDTGILYRAVGLHVLRTGFDPSDETAAIEAAKALRPQCSLGFGSDPALRTEEAGKAASKVAGFIGVREALLTFQRAFAENPPEGKKGAILDGRDIGTVVCPTAPVKIFVTADLEIRAERRARELRSQGLEVIDRAVLEDMRERDRRDRQRIIAPTVAAEDAFVIDTSWFDAVLVLQTARSYVEKRLKEAGF